MHKGVYEELFKELIAHHQDSETRTHNDCSKVEVRERVETVHEAR